MQPSKICQSEGDVEGTARVETDRCNAVQVLSFVRSQRICSSELRLYCISVVTQGYE